MLFKKLGTDIKTVGVMCISTNPEILRISIPNLLKFSDWILLLLDNETEEVKQLALEYQRKYYYKTWLRRSSIPHEVINRNGKVVDYHRRWKGVKGVVRDEIFVNLRRIMQLKMERYDKIDILLFPDSDEIFTEHLPELLERFWQSEYKAVALKMVHVVDNMTTIKDDPMRHHVHIFKWQDDLSGFPWQWQNQMHPIKWSETMMEEYYSVHLAYLTAAQREWRNQNWKNNKLIGSKLWYLDKSVEELRPEEIREIFKGKPNAKLFV